MLAVKPEEINNNRQFLVIVTMDAAETRQCVSERGKDTLVLAPDEEFPSPIARIIVMITLSNVGNVER